MFTGQLGTPDSRLGWLVLGGTSAVAAPVAATGRAESTDTSSHAEAQPVVLKLT